MAEITRKELVDALCDVLDGSDAWDIQNNTGLSIERCEEIINIFNGVKSEWLAK